MLDLITHAARRTRGKSQATALLVGCALGWIAWELSRVPERAGINLVMAIIVVAAGASSCVLFTLHAQGVRNTPSREQRLALARQCLTLLGCGVAMAMHGLQLALA